MATVALIAPSPKSRFEDNNGNAASGFKVFTYQGGTTTKTNTFTDSTGATPNTNPIILNTRGEADIWLTANTNYKFVLAPPTDTDPPTNAVYTADNISVNLPATSIIPCTATGTNTIALTPVSGSVTSYTDQQQFSFYAAATSSGLVTLNVSSVGAKNAYLPGGTQQAGAESFISGQFYVVAFNAALNSNAGGFVKVGQDATSGTFATLASAATCNIGSANAEYIQITGTTTITAFDTALAGIQRTLEFAGALTLTQNATSLILPGAANITTAAGDIAIFRSEGSGNWRCVNYVKASIFPVGTKQATRQVFTSGSGTYTTPAGVTRILVRMIGGGGGGAGSGTSPGNGGSTSTNTTFGTGPLLAANGGGGGTSSAGGAGGTASGGDINLTGGTGGLPSGLTNQFGGVGGGGAYGGAGFGGSQTPGAGGAGVTNTGGGGGGAGDAGTINSGGGGGAGGYCEKLITSPNATYSYAVGAAGAAGTAGTGGAAGGAGGSGLIVVDEYYA